MHLKLAPKRFDQAGEGITVTGLRPRQQTSSHRQPPTPVVSGCLARSQLNVDDRSDGNWALTGAQFECHPAVYIGTN